jgi:hypothetical protein
MKQKTQMPWLHNKGFDALIREAAQRGVWEDMGNGYITKKPKPKMTDVMISEDNLPDDFGTVRLKVDVTNAGNSPRIHFAEDGVVSESSPILKENVLATKALRVQFLAIDPTGKNQTGTPKTWTNKLTIRNKFNEQSRTVELFVAPKGKIKYTLDGSEARNGIEYTQEIKLGNQEANIYVFAECDGLEEKRKFSFPKAGSTEVPIIKEKPAVLVSQSPKRLDSSAKTYDGLKLAKEKNIEFEHVMLTAGSSPKVITLSLSEIRINATFIEAALTHLQTLLPPDAPLVMSFKKVYTHTGHDLEQFAKQLSIEIKNGEVEQK